MTTFQNLRIDAGARNVPADFLAMIEWATATNRAIAPMVFSDALHYLMRERKMTAERLEERTLISTRTIIRLSNNPEYNVTREHIVALSVGLKLPPIISGELLRKAGLLLTNTRLHNAYYMILCVMYTDEIADVNKFLASLNMAPLTKRKC